MVLERFHKDSGRYRGLLGKWNYHKDRYFLKRLGERVDKKLDNLIHLTYKVEPGFNETPSSSIVKRKIGFYKSKRREISDLLSDISYNYRLEY